MVICKSYAKKMSRQKLKSCPDEHINVKHFVKVEMEAAVHGNQWPLSCFGPFSEKPSVPNYIEDQSFEEVRLMYYTTDKCNFIEISRKFTESVEDAKKKMQMLTAMDREVVDVLISVYKYVEPPVSARQPLEEKWDISKSPTSFGNTFQGSFPPPPAIPTVSFFPKAYDVKKFNFEFTSPPAKVTTHSDEKKDNKSGHFSADAMLKAEEQEETASSMFSSLHLLNLQEKRDQPSGFFSSEQLQKLQANAFGSKASQDASTQTPALWEDEEEEDKECELHLQEIVAKLATVQEMIDKNIEIAKGQDKSIAFLTESIKRLEGRMNTPRYTTKTGNELAIMIMPSLKQSSLKTEEHIKSILSPSSLEMRVIDVLSSAHGSILVKCGDVASVEKVESEVVKNCAGHYSTERVKLAKTKIQVSGIDLGVEEDKLIEVIRKQNKVDGQMKFVKSFQRENSHKYNAVLEVDKALFWSIMRNGEPHLYVGWNMCSVVESIDVRRCFKCWGYNHSSRRCWNSKRCPRCAGQHSEKKCTSKKLRCANCLVARVKLNRKIDLAHDVRDLSCRVYLAKVDKQRMLVDY